MANELEIGRLLLKFKAEIYKRYTYRVEYHRKDTWYTMPYWIVKQAFRQKRFNTAKEAFEFLDRAISYDEAHY